MFKISTLENTIHEVPRHLLKDSILIKNMMDEETDEDDEGVFPLPNITDEIFREVMRFAHIHSDTPADIDLPVHTKDFEKLVPAPYLGLIEDWFHREPHAKFMKRVIKAADYLAFDALITMCHAKMQTTIFERNPIEVLRMYGVENAEAEAEKIMSEMDSMYPNFSEEIRKLP